MQAPLLSFLYPGFVVAVAVEDYALVIVYGAANELVQGGIEIGRALQLVCKQTQGLCHGGVQSHVGRGDGGGGAGHTEFKLVAGEGEGRGAVAVGGVLGEMGDGVYAYLHDGLFLAGIGCARVDGVQYFGQLIAEEDGHDGRRRLAGAQTVVVAGGGHGYAQKILIIVHSLDDRAQKQQKLCVFIGGVTGLKKVKAGVGFQRPVVVLAAAVDAFKGLFVQKADKTVAAGDLFHHLHGELIVVGGHVGGYKYGGQLVLGGSHLVMLGLCQHTQIPKLVVQILHELGDLGLYHAEIVVVQLLALGGHGPVQSAASENEILALLKHGLVHKEVFLLGAGGGLDVIHVFVAEQPKYAHCLLVYGLHGAQQGRFAVQSLAAVGAEGCGYAQHAVFYESVGGGVPGGVAPGFKGGPQTAGGEGGSVRLTPYKVGSGKLHNNSAAAHGAYKAVVLFRGDAVERMEPVGEMSGAVFYGPVLHGVGDNIGYLWIQTLAVFDGGQELLIGLAREALTHNVVVKDHGTEDFSCTAHFQNPFHFEHLFYNTTRRR